MISASYTNGPTIQFQSIILSNVMVPRKKWRLDSSIKLLRIGQDVSTSQAATVESSVLPTISASYRLRKQASIEAKNQVQASFTSNPLGHTRNFRDFSFISYRLCL